MVRQAHHVQLHPYKTKDTLSEVEGSNRFINRLLDLSLQQECNNQRVDDQ